MSRSDKVSSTLLKEVSSIIHDEIKDPRLGFITVTDVELTDDLRNAKIYLSILGAPDQERQSLLVLEHAKGFIRKLIAERISLRFVPEIIFRVDKSIEYGMRIEEQLAKIKDEFKKKVIQEIRKRDNFLISSHVSPEGDAIGSELAFKNLLERLGKHSFIVNDHDVPREYKFLPGVNSICKPNQVHYFEVVVTLDCSDLERIGKVRRLIKPGTFIINIDHHISNSGFGDINWVEPKSSCVCEMIYKLFQGLKIRPDKAAAVAMYTGILTDTGSFHYSNTTSFTHQVVSKLLQKNIPVSRIYREIYESYSLAQIKFLGKMISQFNSHNHDKIVWLSLKRNIKDFGEGALELADSILNFARAVKNAEVVLLFKEIGINEVRVNLRSRGNIDVNRLAKTFGGGGHKTASGFTTKGQISTVERQVLKEVKKAFLRS